jgi:hypothetical protein
VIRKEDVGLTIETDTTSKLDHWRCSDVEAAHIRQRTFGDRKKRKKEERMMKERKPEHTQE